MRMIRCRKRWRMSFTDAAIKLFGLLWVTMLCAAGEAAEWPERVLSVDGAVVISGAQLSEKLNELKVPPGELPQVAEQLVLNAARDAVVVNCLKKAGITPSEGLALEVQKLDFARMSAQEKARLAAKLEKLGQSREEYFLARAKDPEVQFQAASSLWVESIRRETAVTDDEINQFYYANPDMFKVPESRTIAVIALNGDASGEQAARDVVAKVLQGERFDLLLERYSVLKGAELGKVSSRPEVAEAGGKLTPENPVDKVKSGDCWVVVKLAEYAPERQAGLSEVREVLRKQLLELKLRDEVNRRIAEESLLHKIDIDLGEE